MTRFAQPFLDFRFNCPQKYVDDFREFRTFSTNIELRICSSKQNLPLCYILAAEQHIPRYFDGISKALLSVCLLSRDVNAIRKDFRLESKLELRIALKNLDVSTSNPFSKVEVEVDADDGYFKSKS